MINCRIAVFMWKIPIIRITTGAVLVRPLNTKLFCTSPVLDTNLQRPTSLLTCRTKASYTAVASSEQGTLKKLLKKLAWHPFLKSRLKRSSYYLYEAIADGVDYASFFKAFKLEDTFFSWYLITELHVWMLLVRVMAEEDEGRYVRNSIIEALWSDVTRRTKLLGASNPAAMRKQRNELFEQFQAAIVIYDEGVLSDDKALAGALWRRFLNCECDDPEKLESLVKYVRKQVRLLDELSRDQLIRSPSVKWISLEPIK